MFYRALTVIVYVSRRLHVDPSDVEYNCRNNKNTRSAQTTARQPNGHENNTFLVEVIKYLLLVESLARKKLMGEYLSSSHKWSAST